MKVEIAWKTPDNFQTKTFKNEYAAIQWIRLNAENVVSVNGVLIHNHFGLGTDHNIIKAVRFGKFEF